MAETYKGLTIQFGADTGALKTALSNTKGQLTALNKEGTKLNKALKFNPDNTILLTQKMDNLRDKLVVTGEKLKDLQAAQDDLDAQGVDKNTEEYRALEREIEQTKSTLSTYDKQLKDTAKSYADATNNTVSFGAKLKSLGATATAAGSKLKDAGSATSGLSKGAAAVGAAAVAASVQVEAGYDNIIKATGATGDAANDLEAVYKNVAGTAPGSFEEVGSAIGEVNTKFGLSGDKLTALSSKYLQFADINGTDVTTAVDYTSNALKQFGESQDNAGNLMGFMTLKAQETGISVDDLGASLVTNGAAFKELGLSTSESVNLMSNFEAAGLDSAGMLQGLKAAASKYSAQGLSMSDGLSGLITDLQDSSTAADATTTAYAMFGEDAGLSFVNAAKSGSISLEGLEDSMDSYGNVVGDTYLQTKSGTDKMKLSFTQLTEATAPLGDSLGDTLAPILDKIAGAVTIVAEKFDGLSDGQKKAIVTVLLVVAALAPLLTGLGIFITMIGNVITAASVIAPVLSAIGAAIGGTLLGPILIVIAVVVAVIALIHHLWTTNEGFRNAIIAIVDAIKEKFFAFLDFITGTLIPGFFNFIASAGDKFNSFKERLSAIITGIKDFFSNGFAAIKDKVSSIITGMKTAVDSKVSAIKDSMVSKFTSAKTTVLGVFSSIKDGITSKVQAAKDKVASIVEGIKSLFSFKISFPSIPIPHISFTGSWDLTPPTLSAPMPHISWNAEGGIFTKPTLLGGMQGVGEAGAEAVLPISRLDAIMANALLIARNKDPQVVSGNTTNLYLDNLKVNDDAGVRAATLNLINELKRKGTR